MKSDEVVMKLRGWRLICARWLFFFWLRSCGNVARRAEAVSRLVKELQHRTERKDRPLDSTTARELMSMRYSSELEAIEKSVAALSQAAFSEDPYVYTECTQAALMRVLYGMGKTHSVLLAWLEENPALHFHNHTTSATVIKCGCDSCQAGIKTIMHELHQKAGQDIERMVGQLQHIAEAAPELPRVLQ